MSSQEIAPEMLMPSERVEHPLPVNIQEDDMDDFVGFRTYDTNDIFLKRVKSAWVSPSSVVYKKGRLINETVVSESQWMYYRFKHLVKKILTGKTVRLDKSAKYLLITDAYSSGHFHWFLEVLEKVVCLKGRTNEFILLLPSTNYIKNIGLESLTMLEAKFQSILFMDENDFYKVEDLYYVTTVSRNGLNPRLLREVRSRFNPTVEKAEKMVYVSRQNAQYRKIVNGTEFETLLTNAGFTVIYAEGMNLRQQIELFRHTKVLISLHGAGLANCIFMQPGGKVIEIRKRENNTSNIGFWHLSSSLNHEYYYFNGVPDSDKPLVGHGCNLTIPLTDFENSLLNRIL